LNLSDSAGRLEQRYKIKIHVVLSRN